MKARNAGVKFDPKDWEKTPFNRWDLKGLKLDPVAGGFVALLEEFLSSPEWETKFRLPLPLLREGVAKQFEEQAADLEKRNTAAIKELEEQTADTEKRKAALLERMHKAAALPALKPDAGTYQLGVRVQPESGSVGLPGLMVRLFEPRDPQGVVAEAATSEDGNAVLVLGKDQVEKLAGKELGVAVVTPGEKVLVRQDKGITPRLQHTQTWLGEVPVSDDTKKDLEPHLAAAKEVSEERTAQLKNLDLRNVARKESHRALVEGLQLRIDDVKAILKNIKEDAEADVGRTGPPSGPGGYSAPRKPTKPGRGD